MIPAIERELREAEIRKERKLAEEKIQLQLEHLAALREIDMAIMASLDMHVTLNVLLDKVMSQLHVDATDILLLNPYTNELEYITGQGFHTSAFPKTYIRLGEEIVGKIALERKSVTINNFQEIQNNLKRASFFSKENFTYYRGIPLIAKGKVKGVLELFHRSVLSPNQEWLGFLEALAGQAAIAIDNATLFDELQHANIELTLAYDSTLEGWSRAMDLRDKETEGHTQRVTESTLMLARDIGAKEDELVHIRRGALLHDIGKMGIPDQILLKPGPLTDEEWVIMRKHPVYAYELLYPIAFLRPAIDIPYCHHEKWDGTGYPRGLKEEKIPLAARIFSIIDVWDALRSDRPYRKAWEKSKVKEHILSQKGTHFDPQVVEAFLKLDFF